MAHVSYSTSQYEFAHGKKPRGSGYWAFFFDGERNSDTAFWFNGPYGAAKEAAKKWAQSKGFTKVEVGS